MHALPILWIIWAGLTVGLMAVLVYRGTLTRYEEDGLFLEDSARQQKEEQEGIQVRLKKLQPAVKFLSVGAGAMTAAILGLYVWYAFREFSL